MHTLGVAVMAHQSRAQWFPYLGARLRDPPLFVDDGSLGIWGNCKRSWLGALDAHPDATHISVIQDDALICRNFHQKAEQFIGALRYPGRHVVNWYLSKRPKFRSAIRQAKTKHQPFLVRSNIHHEMALCLPRAHVEPMVRFVDEQNDIEGTNHDRWINRYVRHHNLKVVFPMPSLVSHRDIRSLHNLNRGKYPPGAAWWIGDKEEVTAR